jgi:hypothetical protein
MRITMADRPGNWTVTAAARLLEEPQHRLIYLCEKGVVEPVSRDVMFSAIKGRLLFRTSGFWSLPLPS